MSEFMPEIYFMKQVYMDGSEFENRIYLEMFNFVVCLHLPGYCVIF